MSDRSDAEDLRLLVVGVNGFVYAGDRLDAIVEAVDWLRANPEVAARLLDRAS